ncbi:NUDIX domain-containing protein [Ectobacillus sp. sgz5001026]|uniref:NUDIX hydrolase n=1 Tax=Ectobacillus sp. sgz5001026 TaxID=3242473 RepID=UPI0036D27AD4
MEREEHFSKDGFPLLLGLPVDICIFTVTTEKREVDENEIIDKRSLRSLPKRFLEILLVKRLNDPFYQQWALPGGYTKVESESLEKAAKRELKEETNLDAVVTGELDQSNSGVYIEQMKAYYRPDRDPRGYTPTVAYVALVNEKYLQTLRAGGDAGEVKLFRLQLTKDNTLRFESEDETVTVNETELAFDHADIIHDSLKHIQSMILTTTIAKTLLSEEFTIAELHQVISTIAPNLLMSTSNFTRDIVKTKTRDRMLEEVKNSDGTPKKSNQYSARPAQLYRFSESYEPKLSIYPRL